RMVTTAIGGPSGRMIYKRVVGPGVPGGGAGIAVAGGPGLEAPGEPGPADVQTEPLGTKEYEGIRAEGTRTVATVPAGARGSARRMESVSNRWSPRALRVVVSPRRADPRFGETVYRLTNVTRAEPDASLFQVPADYGYEDLTPPPFEPQP